MLISRRLSATCLTNRGLSKQVSGTIKSFSMPLSAASELERASLGGVLPTLHANRQPYSTDSGRPKAPEESASAKQTSFPVTKVLFDGDCKLCANEIRMLKTFAKDQPVEFVDITDTKYRATDHQGITYEMAMKEMHVIGPDHKVYTQFDAIRKMYTASGLGWLATLTALPGIRPIADKLYLKFAKYRLQKALDSCDSGSCSVKLHELKKKLDKTP